MPRLCGLCVVTCPEPMPSFVRRGVCLRAPHGQPGADRQSLCGAGPRQQPSSKAELCLPQSAKQIPLEVVKTPEGDIRPTVLRNVTEQIEVVRVKDMYVLSIKGQVKFTHDAVIDSPLNKI